MELLRDYHALAQDPESKTLCQAICKLSTKWCDQAIEIYKLCLHKQDELHHVRPEQSLEAWEHFGQMFVIDKALLTLVVDSILPPQDILAYRTAAKNGLMLSAIELRNVAQRVQQMRQASYPCSFGSHSFIRDLADGGGAWQSFEQLNIADPKAKAFITLFDLTESRLFVGASRDGYCGYYSLAHSCAPLWSCLKSLQAWMYRAVCMMNDDLQLRQELIDVVEAYNVGNGEALLDDSLRRLLGVANSVTATLDKRYWLNNESLYVLAYITDINIWTCERCSADGATLDLRLHMSKTCISACRAANVNITLMYSFRSFDQYTNQSGPAPVITIGRHDMVLMFNGDEEHWEALAPTINIPRTSITKPYAIYEYKTPEEKKRGEYMAFVVDRCKRWFDNWIHYQIKGDSMCGWNSIAVALDITYDQLSTKVRANLCTVFKRLGVGCDQKNMRKPLPKKAVVNYSMLFGFAPMRWSDKKGKLLDDAKLSRSMKDVAVDDEHIKDATKRRSRTPQFQRMWYLGRVDQLTMHLDPLVDLPALSYILQRRIITIHRAPDVTCGYTGYSYVPNAWPEESIDADDTDVARVRKAGAHTCTDAIVDESLLSKEAQCGPHDAPIVLICSANTREASSQAHWEPLCHPSLSGIRLRHFPCVIDEKRIASSHARPYEQQDNIVPVSPVPLPVNLPTQVGGSMMNTSDDDTILATPLQPLIHEPTSTSSSSSNGNSNMEQIGSLSSMTFYAYDQLPSGNTTIGVSAQEPSPLTTMATAAWFIDGSSMITNDEHMMVVTSTCKDSSPAAPAPLLLTGGAPMVPLSSEHDEQRMTPLIVLASPPNANTPNVHIAESQPAVAIMNQVSNLNADQPMAVLSPTQATTNSNHVHDEDDEPLSARRDRHTFEASNSNSVVSGDKKHGDSVSNTPKRKADDDPADGQSQSDDDGAAVITNDNDSDDDNNASSPEVRAIARQRPMITPRSRLPSAAKSQSKCRRPKKHKTQTPPAKPVHGDDDDSKVVTTSDTMAASVVAPVVPASDNNVDIDEEEVTAKGVIKAHDTLMVDGRVTCSNQLFHLATLSKKYPSQLQEMKPLINSDEASKWNNKQTEHAECNTSYFGNAVIIKSIAARAADGDEFTPLDINGEEVERIVTINQVRKATNENHRVQGDIAYSTDNIIAQGTDWLSNMLSPFFTQVDGVTPKHGGDTKAASSASPSSPLSDISTAAAAPIIGAAESTPLKRDTGIHPVMIVCVVATKENMDRFESAHGFIYGRLAHCGVKTESSPILADLEPFLQLGVQFFYMRQMPGDVCVLKGNIVHKFYKPCGSVSLAANAMDRDDMHRTMKFYQHCIGVLLDHHNDKNTFTQGAVYDHITFGVRDSWHPLIYQSLIHRQWLLIWVIPILARAIMLDDIQPGARVLSLVWFHRYEAIHIDNGERYIPTRNVIQSGHKELGSDQSLLPRPMANDGNYGMNWLTVFAICRGREYGVDRDKDAQDMIHVPEESFRDVVSTVPIAWRDVLKKPIPEELIHPQVFEHDELRQTKGHASGGYASKDRYVHVPSAAEIKQESDTKVKLLPDVKHAYLNNDAQLKLEGYHTVVPMPRLPDGKRLSDNSHTFRMHGGYNRYSEHVSNAPGIFGYTAKLCRAWSVTGRGIGWSKKNRKILLDKGGWVLPDDNAPSEKWPYFLITGHRECLGMSSINVFVGYHKKLVEQLLKQRISKKLDCSVLV